MWIYRLLRWGLAIVFICSASIKSVDFEAFAGVVSDFGLVPDGLVHLTAATLIVLEVAGGWGLPWTCGGA